MSVKWLTLLLAAALMPAVLAQDVEFEVRVTADGEAVTDLEANDFVVKENGKPQTLTKFEFVRAPEGASQPIPGQPTWIYIALQISPREWPQVRDGIQKFIDNEVRPEFQVSIGGAPFTADREELSQYLKDGPPEGGIRLPVIWQIDDNNLELQGRIALSRYLTVQRAMSLRPGKKMMVLFRSGLSITEEFDIGGSGPGQSGARIMAGQRGGQGMAAYKPDEDRTRNQAYLDQLVSAAVRSRVSIFIDDTLGVRTTGGAESRGTYAARPDVADAEMTITGGGQGGLLRLAEDTGGRVVYSNDHSEVFAAAGKTASEYYLIGYSPSDQKQKGRIRKVNVAVNRKGVQVIAPKGYLESRPFKDMKQVERALHLQQSLAFEGESTGFPVRVNYGFFRNSEGKAALVYSVGAHPREFKGKSSSKGLTLSYTVATQLLDPATQSVVAYDERMAQQTYPKQAIEQASEDENIMIELSSLLETEPGGYQLRVLIRDESTGKIGGYSTTMAIPDVQAPYSTSSMLVTRRGVQGEQRGPANPPLGDLLDIGQWRLTPECGVVYKVGDPVFVMYDVYDVSDSLLTTPPPLQIALELSGQMVRFAGAGQPAPVPERNMIRYLVGINTEQLAPGDYSVFARVPSGEDGGTSDIAGKFTLIAAQ